MEKQSKKDIMFDRMKEKKKEVRVVRRIVLIVALVLLLIVAVAGWQAYSYVTEALAPVDPDSASFLLVFSLYEHKRRRETDFPSFFINFRYVHPGI